MHATRKSKPADDSVNLENVSAEKIQAVIKFLPIFENLHPDDFAHMVRPPESTDGICVVGHLEYHPAVNEFVKACYENGFVQSFDWGAWADEARPYMRDPALVESARLATCIKLITAHLRYERFCDGHLQVVLKTGHIAAILRRLKKLDATSRT